MNSEKKKEFLQIIKKCIDENTFVRLLLINKKNKADDLKKIIIRPVQLKAGFRLSFVYRYSTNDLTKNYNLETSLKIIDEQLENNFAQADLHDTKIEHYFSYPEKGKTKIKSKILGKEKILDLKHDHQKNRLVSSKSPYLYHLGISSVDGKVLKDKQDKFKQINKFIEIIDPIIEKANLPDKYTVSDMGSGKGYLTFALYDHLKNRKNHEPVIKGIEIRSNLVEQCNAIARSLEYNDLSFHEGNIETSSIESSDILIALHACNTATDDAIAAGINKKAKIIVCSPCCHKQVRKQMKLTPDVGSILQYGILKERQAEIVTDTIRALILEGFGYKTNVMEFISTSHTPKNLLIVATFQQSVEIFPKSVLEKIQQIRKTFGVEYHFLEKLMKLV